MATASVVSSTISGNNTGGSGGGIFSGAAAICSSSTPPPSHQAGDSGRRSLQHRRIEPRYQREVNVANPIIAGNTALTDGNDVFNGNGGVIHHLAQNFMDGDPMIGPLQNNGGPTLRTHRCQAAPRSIPAITRSSLGSRLPTISAAARSAGSATVPTTTPLRRWISAPSRPIRWCKNIPDLTGMEGNSFSVTFRVGRHGHRVRLAHRDVEQHDPAAGQPPDAR